MTQKRKHAGRTRAFTAEQLAMRGNASSKVKRRTRQEAEAPAAAVNTAPTVAAAQSRNWSSIAEQYARDVVAEKIPAGKWVKLACKRHLADLERDASFPYRFDAEVANRWCARVEQYPHIKGKWAAAKRREDKLIKLEPWQCFFECSLYGWVRKSDGKRRFRKGYICVPRKNAKSTLAAANGLNHLTIDGEIGAEVYSGATSEKQAWEVFGPARLMMDKSPTLCKEHGVEVLARSICRMEDNSRFLPVIGNPGDGPSPSCAIVDEYHEHNTSALYDTMLTGMGAREQPMLMVITTAGTNLASPCYDLQKHAEKVLDGIIQDEQLFAIIYSIDEDDDWADARVLEKANPNIGVSVDREYLIAQQNDARVSPSSQNRFRTKHLNEWCNASVAGINMHLWRKAADPTLKLADFKGQRAHGALDLASKSDICSFAQVFSRMQPTPVKDEAGRMANQMRRHYYAFTRNYLPEATIEENGPNQTSYRNWHARQFLTATPGTEIEFDIVKDDVIEYGKQFQLDEICYDPWRATQLAQQLTREGATMIEMPQNARHMGAAFDEFISALKSGRFHHNGDPVLEWMASNIVAKSVAKGLTVPSKEKMHLKIDGIVAIVMAISRAMVSQETGGIDGWLRAPVVVGERRAAA